MKEATLKYKCGIDCRLSKDNPGFHCMFFYGTVDWIEKVKFITCPVESRKIKNSLIDIETMEPISNYTSVW